MDVLARGSAAEDTSGGDRAVRIANQYGLFAVMTRHRYEIEFQGSNDGQTWTAYPFRFKPQIRWKGRRIYAPYQPAVRLESVVCVAGWMDAETLWFRGLRSYCWKMIVICSNYFEVIRLAKHQPKYVRAVLWQYWFSTPEQKRAQGVWWTREFRRQYTPVLTRGPDGRVRMVRQLSLEDQSDPLGAS